MGTRAAVPLLRTVPNIVIAHTFGASRDIRLSYGWHLLLPEYFCPVQNYGEKKRT